MKIHLYIFALLIFLSACKSGSVLVNSGEKAYEQKKFVLAANLLEKEAANENDPIKKVDLLLLLASSYDQMNNLEKKASTFEKITATSQNSQYLYDLALAYMNNEDYEKALQAIKEYKSITNDVFYSNPIIKLCEDVKSYDETKDNIRISNLEELNSSAADYALRPNKNNQWVFTSSRASATGELIQYWDNQKNSDLFQAQLTKNGFTQIEGLPAEINTALAEGTASFSANGDKIYFTRCDYLEIGNSYCQIYEADADGSFWYEATLLPIFGDTVNIGQPHINEDGSRLYFSSDAPYGYGGNDIYFMINNNGVWSEPYNAGFSINTEKDELFPTTDKKGNLYFSSNGKQGYGGLDIFKASPDKFAFGPATHLPYPINSGADDFSFTLYKEMDLSAEDDLLEAAYFSSNRKGGNGSDDIYRYEKIFFNLFELNLTVLENEYADSLDSESAIIGLSPLSNAQILLKGQENSTKEDGVLVFQLAPDTDYKFLVSKNGYFNQSVSVGTKGLSDRENILITLTDSVVLEKIFPEKEIVIPNIYYDYDKASLRAESLPVLDQLVSFFEENSDLTIEIGSHTDSRGSDSYNLDLSQRRAQSVVDYLIEKGVPSSQLQAKGYGETKITNRCINGVECSEEEHQANRRTTFRVISASGVIESE